jgi:hypothetical protein
MSMIRRTGIPVAALSIVAAMTLTACGSDADTATPAGGGGNGAMSVKILEPASGASVALPMNVKVESSVKLDKTETGEHHVHVYFDNNEDDYLIMEATSGQITDTPKVTPGQHVMHVSLRNADHSPAGVETQIPVTVTGGGGGAPTPADTEDDGGGPYGY